MLGIIDILLLADPVMKISSSVDDPKTYVHLTDCLIKQIETSKEPGLADARRLLDRLRRRQLYKVVFDQILAPDVPSTLPVNPILTLLDPIPSFISSSS
jgi:hypothetical protein